MFLPIVEIARQCRRLRQAMRIGVYPADAYWTVIDTVVAEIRRIPKTP